jgi:REP element-mobilizing transposase RayT
MANTYTQLYAQVVFAPKYREACIKDDWKHLFYQYIIGITENHEHKMLAINGMSDHIHIFIGLKPQGIFVRTYKNYKRIFLKMDK